MPELLRLRAMPEVDGQEHYGAVLGCQTSGNNTSGNESSTNLRTNGSRGKTDFEFFGRYQGLFYTLLCSFVTLGVNSLYRDTNQYSAVGVAFYVSIWSSSFTFPSVIWYTRSFPKVTQKLLINWTALILLVGVAGLFRIYAFQLLPIGEASSICFSTPIFTAIFARLILKDRLTWMTFIALLLSIVGMLLTMRLPELITSGGERLGSIKHLIGCCCALANVICASGMFIIIRYLRDISSLLNSFVQLVGMAIFYACLSPAFGGFFIPPCDIIIIVKIISIGILFYLFVVLLNLALQKDDPTTVGTVFRSAEIFLGFLVQLTVFKESVDAFSISGAVVVFACGMLMPLQKWMQGQKETSVWRESWLIKLI